MTATGYPAPCIDLPGGAANSTGAIASATAGQVMGWRSYTLNSATSGTSYGGRFQHYVTGAAGSGAALRAYGLVKGVSAATLYGLEASAEIMSTTSSAITGICAAVKADTILNLSASGTVAVMDLNYTVAANKSAQAGTKSSFIRVGNTLGAGATGCINLFEFADTRGTAGAATIVNTDHANDIVSGANVYVRCVDPTGTFYLLGTTTAPAAS